MEKEDVLQKSYLKENVQQAIANSELTQKSFQAAINALENAQKEQDKLLDRREQVASDNLKTALDKLSAAKSKFLAQTRAPDYVLKTAKGAEAQLEMAKVLPFLSEDRRKELETGKQNLETLRYLALANYLLGSKKNSKTDIGGTDISKTNIEEALAQSLLVDEKDLSAEERESVGEFKNKLLVLARRLQSYQTDYQEELVKQQVMQMQLDQLKEATEEARAVIKKADPEDTDETLSRLRVELGNYQKIKEQLQRQTSVRDLGTLGIQTRATALEIIRLIQKQRQISRDQLLRRLSASLRAELKDEQQKSSEIAEAMQDAVDAIQEERENQNEIVDERIESATTSIGKLEAALEEATAAFEEAEAKLHEEEPEETVFSLWPTSLKGTQQQIEDQIVAAMKKFNIAKMKLENAKPDEIDPETGKFVSCVTESVSLSEYQKALMHYVNDNFKVLPGVLILWEPGTGKTQGAISACVENLFTRYVEGKPNEKGGVDVLILGFTNDNLNDFRKTLLTTIERELKGRFEMGKSGGDEEASRQVIRVKITGNDNVDRTATIVIQRYSVGASEASELKMNPDGIIVVDEAHFMVTREVPTASTNIAQVRATVAAWEKVVADFDGVKLILTATPSGAKRDPEMLMKLLKYMKPERGFSGKDTRDVTAYKKWFKQRADGLGVEWVSEAAKKEFEQEWLRARISYVALRFDKRVFPQIETKCGPGNEQCIFEVGKSGELTLAPNRRRLSAPEIDARQMLEYGRMAPTLVQVPLTLEESKDFEKKSVAKATSVNTRNPELATCAENDKPISEWSDEEVQKCGGYAHYTQKGGVKGQWASGGGFDIVPKLDAVHKVIDSITKTTGPTRHIIIASGYENANTFFFQKPLIKEFKDFDQIEQKNVSSPEAAAKTMKLTKKPRIALLTGTTWSGLSSQTKTVKQKQLMKKIFFSDANVDGGIIQVLIVDASMLTGFDAKGATHLHILSPVLNQQQAWSRILRRCAQPVAKSTVYVYTYKTYIPDDVKKAKDNKITVTPDEMVLESLRRKNQIVQPIDLLMREMIADSYDRYWFAEYSTGGGVKVAEVGEGKVPIQPLTQQEYLIWRIFDSLVPEEMKEEDVEVDNESFGEPIGVAAAAKALGANPKKEGGAKGRSLSLAAAAIAKRAKDAATRFFRGKRAAVERQVGVLPPLPQPLETPALPSRNAPRNDIHQFAQDFFIGEPWVVADPVRFSQANVSDKKSETIIENLTHLVDMSMLVDLSLLTVFVAEKISDQRREQITAMLDERMLATPPALLRSYEDYFILQELANAQYRQVIQKTMELDEAKRRETAELNAQAELVGNTPGPELPPTPPDSPSVKFPSLPPTPGGEDQPPSLPPPAPRQASASSSPSTPSLQNGDDSEFIENTTNDWNNFVKNLNMTPVAVPPSPSPTLKDSGKAITYPSLNPYATQQQRFI